MHNNNFHIHYILLGGAVVGYITNWIALKWIFEPLNPTRLGPFILQGMFLKRQKEVSIDFCEYLCKHIITSQQVWKNIFIDGRPQKQFFENLIYKNIPLPHQSVGRIIHTLQQALVPTTTAAVSAVTCIHPLHSYIGKWLCHLYFKENIIILLLL